MCVCVNIYIFLKIYKYVNTKNVDLYRSQQFCLFNSAYTVFITDVVVPVEMYEPENAALFKIFLKFISKNKPLML